jgi:hypothetical protein
LTCVAYHTNVKKFVKMVILRLWTIFFVFLKLVCTSDGATHWVVTEKGMIQSHVSLRKLFPTL